jgi:anti-sigma-K factor RskA
VHGVIDLHDPVEREGAAAEYVLGTLDAADHAAVTASLRDDAALRAEVYACQDRLLALSRHAAPQVPSEALWRRIDAALNALPGSASAVRPAVAAPRAPWWQGLRLWQGLSALAVAASLLLSALLLTRPGEPAGERYVAVLQSPDNQATGWVVELQAGGKLRLVPVGAASPVPPGRALQFWTKPEGAAGPTSLGLVRAGQTIELPVSRLPAVEAQQLFEITLEPENGSPIGRPTGPILFVGRTVAL